MNKEALSSRFGRAKGNLKFRMRKLEIQEAETEVIMELQDYPCFDTLSFPKAKSEKERGRMYEASDVVWNRMLQPNGFRPEIITNQNGLSPRQVQNYIKEQLLEREK